MTQDQWDSMTPAERNAARDNSGLTRQLIGFEGDLVEVIDNACQRRRFKVGRSTGWRPCHLELQTVRSIAGDPADNSYQSVKRV